jgi:hypothetical protein
MIGSRTSAAWLLALALALVSLLVLGLRPDVEPSSDTAPRWRIRSFDQPHEPPLILSGHAPIEQAQRHFGQGAKLFVEPLDSPSASTPSDAWPSPASLSPGPRRVAEFLLLLPIATFIVCLARVFIGLSTFGTFAPALLGLAFRDTSPFLALFLLLTMILFGWWLRGALQPLGLLQAPRASIMLAAVSLFLLALLLLAEHFRIDTTRAVGLFPLVILTGVIERFWSLDEDEGGAASFSALTNSLLLAGVAALLCRWNSLVNWVLHHPEIIGLVIAVQLPLGRYMGYRLLELIRFSPLIHQAEGQGGA